MNYELRVTNYELPAQGGAGKAGEVTMYIQCIAN